MAATNRKRSEQVSDPSPLDFSELTIPGNMATPHVLQRLLIERLGETSGVEFPLQPSLVPFVEQAVEAVSRLGGLALFGAAFITVVLMLI